VPDLKRLRGLRALVTDAVVHGSAAVEKVHLATAGRTFRVLEALPPAVAEPTRLIHGAHDAIVSGVYTIVRATTTVVGTVVDAGLSAAERAKARKAAEDAGGGEG